MKKPETYTSEQIAKMYNISDQDARKIMHGIKHTDTSRCSRRFDKAAIEMAFKLYRSGVCNERA